LPAPPGTGHLDEIAGQAGNAQLLELFNRREPLKSDAQTWRDSAEAVAQRMPRWNDLERLLCPATGLPIHDDLETQVDAIREHPLAAREPRSGAAALSVAYGCIASRAGASPCRVQEGVRETDAGSDRGAGLAALVEMMFDG
jgi:hypothetical protein